MSKAAEARESKKDTATDEARKGMTSEQRLRVVPISQGHLRVYIWGISSIISKRLDEKTGDIIAAKSEAKAAGTETAKSNVKDTRSADQRVSAARHVDENGIDYIGGNAVAAAIRHAIKLLPGNQMGKVFSSNYGRSIFVLDDKIPILLSQWRRRDDAGRASTGGGAIVINRAEYPTPWGAIFNVEYDADLMTDNDILNLVVRAGAYSGLYEWRPSAGNPGPHGRFKIATAAERKQLDDAYAALYKSQSKKKK